MATIELSIALDYLPKWKTWEGVRELIQNGIDAEKEFGAPFCVWHQGNWLILENKGANIDRSALLLGQTSKRDRDDLIGHFGEGLKLGVLALLREGRSVVVKTQTETWKPRIGESTKFKGTRVLMFDVTPAKRALPGVRVEIGPIDAGDWDVLRPRFLHITPPIRKYATDFGELLLDPGLRGHLFVKGIFVQHDGELQYGYNFSGSVSTDRDRRMVDSFDRKYYIGRIWNEAASQDPGLRKIFIQNLAAFDGISDMAGVELTLSYLDSSVSQECARNFQADHGHSAIPVKSTGESAELAHFGAKGVVVPATLQKVLQPILGSVEKVKLELAKSVKKVFNWDELDPGEQANFRWVQERLASVSDYTGGSTDIVEFSDPKLQGLYDNGKIQVSRNLLKHHHQILRVLIHEWAHREGNDGEKAHVAEIERLWGEVLRALVPGPA